MAFGLSGIFSLLTNSSRYVQGNYFQSQEFNSQMDQFIAMLNVYELYGMPKAEMKKQITVTDEEIEEHRTRYGNLAEQISNIRMQYEDQIQVANDTGNKAVEAVLKKERDAKVADITENFKSDEYVRAKVVKEKEKKIDEFYKGLQSYQREFNNLEGAFKYYLKDNATGEVYTNLTISKGKTASDYLNKKEMYYLQDYENLQNIYMYEIFMPFNEVAEEILRNHKDREVTGQIGLSKHASEKNSVIMNYRDYQKGQTLFFGYLLTSIATLIASYFLGKRKLATVVGSFDQWKPIYRKIPLDVRAGILLTTLFFLLLSMSLINQQFVYYHENFFANVIDLIVSLIVAASLLAFAWIQLSFLSEYRNDWPKFEEEMKKR